jgi:hypothetical protein
MKTVDFKDLDFSKEMPSRKFIGETLFINLTEYKTFRNQQVYRLMMTPKHRLYDKSKSNVGGWVGIDVELDEDVWIDEDTVVIGKSVIYGAIEITHGSRINNCSIIGNGTIRAANINKSEIRGSFNIGHGTEIKKSTLDGITILDMTAINLGKVKIAMENCNVNGRLIVEGRPGFYLRDCTVSGGLIVFKNHKVLRHISFSAVDCEFMGDNMIDFPERQIQLLLEDCFVNNSIIRSAPEGLGNSGIRVIKDCEINNEVLNEI